MKNLLLLLFLIISTAVRGAGYPVTPVGDGGIEEWTPTTNFATSTIVWESEKFYKSLNAHLSSATFTVDLTAGDWIEMSDDLNREPDLSVATNTLVRWDGVSGDDVKDSGVVLNDSDEMRGPTLLEVDNLRLDLETVSTFGNDLHLASASGTIIMDDEVNFTTLAVSRPMKVDGSGNATSTQIVLSDSNDVIGVLPIANGGTATSTDLFNDRLMLSVGGVITEQAAMTDAQMVIGTTGAAPFLGVMNGDATMSATGTVSLVDSAVLSTELAKLGLPPFSTLQDLQNIYHSTGRFDGGVISDGGGGTIDVALGTGSLRATNSETAELLFMDWSATSTVALTNNAVSYVYVAYNGGVPRVEVTLLKRSDLETNIWIGTVTRDGTNTHISNATEIKVSNHPALMALRLIETQPFARVSGGIVGETGTRNLTVTAGSWWEGLTPFTTSAIDTSAADTFDYFYRDGGGGFTEVVTQTQYDNTQYDDGTGVLATLTNNRYGVHWIYLEQDSDLSVLYGRGDYNLSQAENANEPGDKPPRLTNHGRLIAKLIVQKNSATALIIESAFERNFEQSAPTDHGLLLGLADDDHAQYALLLGRAGGQTLAGGNAASEALTLQSTNDGVKGNIFFGNSTYDEFNQRLGVGTTTPELVVHIDSNSASTTGVLRLENNIGNFDFFTSDANPESGIVGFPGDIAVDSTNGILYIKETGVGTNTGWVPVGAGGSLSISSQGQAASTTTALKFPNSHVTDLGSSEFLIETGNDNLLVNPDFESVIALDSWITAVGTSDATTSEALRGSSSVHIFTTAETLFFFQTATSTAFEGKQMAARCDIKSSLKGLQVCSQIDGISSDCTDYDGSNLWKTLESVFVAPSSGSMGVLITSSATTTGDIFADSCYVGEKKLLEVSQSIIAGVSHFETTANCDGWARTSTSLGDFSTDADCPGPTIDAEAIGDWQTTDNDLPQQTIKGLNPGTYKVSVRGVSIGSTTSVQCLAISDGTTTGNPTCVAGAASEERGLAPEAVFTYTDSGDRTFKLQGSIGSGTITLQNAAANETLSFIVTQYPLKSQIHGEPPTAAFEGFFDPQASCAPSLGTGDDGTTWQQVSDADCNNFTQASGTGFTEINDSPTDSIGISGHLKSGRYEACFTGAHSFVGAVVQHFRLAYCTGDNACAVTGERYTPSVTGGGSGTDNQSVDVCGVLDIPNTGTWSIQLHELTSFVSGLSINEFLGTSDQRQMNFTIKPLETISSLNFKDQVKTPGSGAGRSVLVSALVDASEAITEDISSFLSSCTDADPSICSFSTGFFNAKPHCWANPLVAGELGDVTSTSQTTATIDRTNLSTPFSLFCKGSQ